MEKYVVAVIVILVAALVMYMIQYCSVFSPGVVEFDASSKKEIKLMIAYNHMSDSVFKIYVGTIATGAIVGLYFSLMFVIMSVILFQLTYLILSMSIMLSMYIRNKKYFSYIEVKTSQS